MKTTDIAYRKLISRLKQLREAKGFKQSDLAVRLGRPQSYVSRVERFQASLALTEFVQWSRALDESSTELFETFSADVPRRRARLVAMKDSSQ